MSDKSSQSTNENSNENTVQSPKNEQNTPASEKNETSKTTPKQPEKPIHTPVVAQTKNHNNNSSNSSGKGIAVGALVLSLLALGASGFLFVQGQNTLKNQELQFNRSLDKAALGNSENGVLLQNALTQQNLFNQQVEDIKKTQADNEQRLNNVQAAYAELLKGRMGWLINEVEVTLNVASQQLLLSGNVPMAISMLENIEQRLNRFDQPELLPIKQAISQDLSTLKTLPYINISATTLHLDRLQNSLNDLPLIVDDTLQAQNKPTPSSQASNFMQRTWENTVNAVKDMVEVRKLQSNDTMLLAPEQIYFIRENLRLRLLDARLALMQHNNEVYQNDLNAIETTVKQYFNVQAQSTQDWLKELDSLKISNIKTVSDETLKNSINAVRAYQNNMQNTISIALPENNDTTIISASDTTSIASGEETKDETRAASEPNKNASEPASQAGGKTL